MQHLDNILPLVKKPARYAGGEWNAVHKDWSKTDLRLAFAFPDVYEVGMSHLGLQVLYDVVNRRPDALMERVFAPWPDMAEIMKAREIPLFTLESRRPLHDFDALAFTLQYELSYTNVLYMLDLSGIAYVSDQRGEDAPLIIAGGPCAYNPEPLSAIFDLFVVGEGEEVLGELLDALLDGKNRRLPKKELLLRLASLRGVYVPRFYETRFMEDGAFKEILPVQPGVPGRIGKRIIRDMDKAAFPERPVVPSTEVLHDRIMLEVMRGCARGCRFCQSGIIHRPVREKSPDTVLRQAEQQARSTGHDEMSLTSLSSSDYTPVRQVVQKLIEQNAECGINITLPSLRADNFSVELAKEVQRLRRSSLTFAPEAGTQRLRDVINKGVTEEALLGTVETAFREGWHAVKLYFMIGLPTEREEDLDGIARLAREALALGRKAGVPRGRLRVTVSVSSFVPKAHTPFQWEPQATLAELKEKQAYLAGRLKIRGIEYSYHEAEASFLEAVFARGDRRLGSVLIQAYQMGCKFDAWSEHFNFSRWMDAFEKAGLDPAWYANRRYAYDDPLPWDHIDCGVLKNFLIEEHGRAMAARTTEDCRGGQCHGCGICQAYDTEPVFMWSE